MSSTDFNPCPDNRDEAPTLSGHYLTIRRRAVPVVRVVVVLRARRVDVPRVVRVAGVRRTQPPVAGRSYNALPFIIRPERAFDSLYQRAEESLCTFCGRFPAISLSGFRFQ